MLHSLQTLQIRTMSRFVLGLTLIGSLFVFSEKAMALGFAEQIQEKLQSPDTKRLVIVTSSPVHLIFSGRQVSPKNTSPMGLRSLKFTGPIVETLWVDEEVGGDLVLREYQTKAKGESQIQWSGLPLPLELHLAEGKVEIENWTEDILVDCLVGKVSLHNISGAIEAFGLKTDFMATGIQQGLSGSVFNGDLKLDGAKAPVAWQAFSGNTNISGTESVLQVEQNKGEINLGKIGTQAEITARSGNIHFAEQTGRLVAQTEDGTIFGRIGSSGDYSLRSTNGKIQLSAPKTLGSNVDLLSDEGEIYLPKSLRVLRGPAGERKFKGMAGETDGSSSARVRARSKNGSISVNLR